MTKCILFVFIFISPLSAKATDWLSTRIALNDFSVLDKKINGENNAEAPDIDFDGTHQFLSNQVMQFADGVDSLFERFARTDKKNKTRVILSSKTTAIEGKTVYNKFDIKARLNLPHLEELLKIKIKTQKRVENLPKSEEFSDHTIVKEVDKNYYFLDWKFSSQLGVDVSLKPDVFLSIDENFEFGDKDNVGRIVNSSYIYGRTGIGDKFQIEYDRLVRKDFLFRLENAVVWSDKENTLNFEHGPELYWTYDDVKTFFFDIKAHAEKQNESYWVIERYSGSIVYNMRLFRRWLLLKTGPKLEYLRSQNFDSQWSYFIQFQLYIGSF